MHPNSSVPLAIVRYYPYQSLNHSHQPEHQPIYFYDFFPVINCFNFLLFSHNYLLPSIVSFVIVLSYKPVFCVSYALSLDPNFLYWLLFFLLKSTEE